MAHALDLLLRLIGALLLVPPAFLRENEEGKIQNRLEEAWIRIDDAKAHALSATNAFVQEASRISLSFFTTLFGSKLFSFRAAGVSICLSMSSLFLFCLTVIIAAHRKQPLDQWTMAWGLGVGLLLLGIYPAFKKQGDRLWLWGATLFVVLGELLFVLIVAMLSMVKLWGAYSAIKFSFVLVFCLFYSFASDFAYVAATRWMLARVNASNSTSKNVGILTLNALLGVFLFAYPIFLGVFLIWQLNFQAMGIGIAFASSLNSIDLIICCVFLGVAVLMLVHRAFWPAVERPMYAIQRYAIQKKAWLWTIGGALLLHPPGFASILKWIGKKILGAE